MNVPRASADFGAGLDGWSLLGYEPWAEKRETSLELWKKAADKLDWEIFDNPSDSKAGEGCRDPQPAPPSVAAAFLAAAARANDDSVTAARLEKAVDRYLVCPNGLYYLNLDRTWRIGATAHRIISLAESNGSRFRGL